MQRGIQQLAYMIENKTTFSDYIIGQCLSLVAKDKQAAFLALGTPLLSAIKAGRPQLVGLLLACGARTGHPDPARGAVVFAVCGDHVRTVGDTASVLEVLLDRGADISSILTILYQHEPLSASDVLELSKDMPARGQMLFKRFHSRASCAVRAMLAARAATPPDMVQLRHFGSALALHISGQALGQDQPLTAVVAGERSSMPAVSSGF